MYPTDNNKLQLQIQIKQAPQVFWAKTKLS